MPNKPFTQKFELFQTVANLHQKGTINLSASERTQIERQTMDLVRKSLLNRKASNAPAGFDEVLKKLETIPNPDAAFALITEFMEAEGLLSGDADDMGDGDGDSDDSLGNLPGAPPPFGKGKGPGPGPGKGLGPKKDDDGVADDDEDADDDKDGGKDDKGGNKDKAPSKGGPPMANLGNGKAKAGPSIKDLQDRTKDVHEFSAEEVGIESASPDLGKGVKMSSTSKRASMVRVDITASKTIVARHEELGPVFHAVPSASIRNSRTALRRLANRLYGIIVHEGYAKAAALCNSKMLRTAGVDDGVEVDHVEGVEPVTSPVTEGAEFVSRETPAADSDSVTNDVEVVTRDKPTIASAKRKAILRRAKMEHERRMGSGSVLDKADNVNSDPSMKPKKPSMDTTDGADFNFQQKPDLNPSADGVLSGHDVDYKSANEHYSKLYASRLLKEKEAFVRRFVRAVRIAATRMRLNHEEHPLKSAAVDVLSAESGTVEFSNSDIYRGMDVNAAVELTELIMDEGHDQFLSTLLTRAAELMEKDDRYLADVESDLSNLMPVAVVASVGVSVPSRHSGSRRKEAREGNFENNPGSTTPDPSNINNAPRTALFGGDTSLGRRLSRYESARR